MASYQIELVGDVLKVGFNYNEPANGDRLVCDAASRLDELITQGILSGGSLLKIDGPCSIPIAYVIAHKVSHLYKAIAIFDPKIGTKGSKTYIVAISHTPEYKIGQLIETRDTTLARNSPIKVVICGPPRTGKSCLREGLVKAISAIEGASYPYVITASPDGEGAWFSQTAQRDLNLATSLKENNRAEFTSEFARLVSKWVKEANNPLNLIDVGGLISEENRSIMAQATHSIILAKNQDEANTWKRFCDELNLQAIAIINSDYYGETDIISARTPILTGTIHQLKRGQDIRSRPMVKELANLLVRLVKLPLISSTN